MYCISVGISVGTSYKVHENCLKKATVFPDTLILTTTSPPPRILVHYVYGALVAIVFPDTMARLVRTVPNLFLELETGC